jgi:hypothetical protein
MFIALALGSQERRQDMRLSMTTFSTFVTASPVGKVSCVRKFKSGYDPRHDFYKRLREAIVKNHQDGNTPANLNDFLETVSAESKVDNYKQRVRSYQSWWKRHEIVWRGGRSRTWNAGALEISIRPELLVDLDEVPHAIKLYFNKDRLSADRANVLLRLLELGYRRGTSDPEIGVLDVVQRRLITTTRDLSYLDAVFTGEAAAFDAMYQKL